jgi:hypothetical protein
MSNVRLENLQDNLEKKSNSFQIKITTRVNGRLKNHFMDDCKKRLLNESKTALNIIDIYYTIIEIEPMLKGKEFSEIKKYLIDRIKL